MLFRDVVGQEELKHKIIQLIHKGHLPHAILLAGSEGSGGLPLALAVAQYINCSDKQEFDACGLCSSCTKMNKLQHPDVHFSFPTYKKDSKKIPRSNDFIREFREFVLDTPYGNDIDWLNKLETDKQGNITAEECREIIQKLQLRSFEAEYKILIMWYPEYLGKEGNILLKLIEEPTAKTILLFVTENAENILPTILSRTQLFKLQRISDNEIKEALVSNLHVDERRAIQLSRIAEGNFNYAVKLSKDAEDDLLGIVKDWLNFIYTNKGLELSMWVDEMNGRNKESQKKFLEYFILLLEHLIRFNQIGAENLTMLDAELKLVNTLSNQGLSGYAIDLIATRMSDAIYHLERNANTKILFHSLSLHVQQIIFEHKKNLQSA